MLRFLYCYLWEKQNQHDSKDIKKGHNRKGHNKTSSTFPYKIWKTDTYIKAVLTRTKHPVFWWS